MNDIRPEKRDRGFSKKKARICLDLEKIENEATPYIELVGAGDGNRTHVKSLGSLVQATKTFELAAFLMSVGLLRWIPVRAAMASRQFLQMIVAVVGVHGRLPTDEEHSDSGYQVLAGIVTRSVRVGFAALGRKNRRILRRFLKGAMGAEPYADNSPSGCTKKIRIMPTIANMRNASS